MNQQEETFYLSQANMLMFVDKWKKVWGKWHKKNTKNASLNAYKDLLR